MREKRARVDAAGHPEAAIAHHRMRLRIGAADAHRHGQRLHQQRGLVQRRVVVALRLAALALVAQDGLREADEARLLVGREVVSRTVLRGEHDEGVARRVAAIVARVVEQGERRASLRAAPWPARDGARAHGRECFGLARSESLALVDVFVRRAYAPGTSTKASKLNGAQTPAEARTGRLPSRRW